MQKNLTPFYFPKCITSILLLLLVFVTQFHILSVLQAISCISVPVLISAFEREGGKKRRTVQHFFSFKVVVNPWSCNVPTATYTASSFVKSSLCVTFVTDVYPGLPQSDRCFDMSGTNFNLDLLGCTVWRRWDHCTWSVEHLCGSEAVKQATVCPCLVINLIINLCCFDC